MIRTFAADVMPGTAMLILWLLMARPSVATSEPAPLIVGRVPFVPMPALASARVTGGLNTASSFASDTRPGSAGIDPRAAPPRSMGATCAAAESATDCAGVVATAAATAGVTCAAYDLVVTAAAGAAAGVVAAVVDAALDDEPAFLAASNCAFCSSDM